jgi:hypothetical protein
MGALDLTGGQAMSIEAFGDLPVPNLEAMHRFVRMRTRLRKLHGHLLPHMPRGKTSNMIYN